MLSHHPRIELGSRHHPVSYLEGTGAFPLGVNYWSVKLTINLHLISKLLLRGAIQSLRNTSSGRGP
jgi:hypothetical protein